MNRRQFIRRGALLVPAAFSLPQIIVRATPSIRNFRTAGGTGNNKPKTSGGGGGFTYSFINHAIANSSGFLPATTGTIDCTGANLIILAVVWSFGGMSVSDNKSNSYTARTVQTNPSNADSAQLFDCISPTVGSSMTFTAQGTSGGGYPTIIVIAAKKTGGTPIFDSENGTTFSGSGTTRTIPSLTPSGNNEFGVCAMSTGSPYSGTPTAVTAGYTITDSRPAAGAAYVNQTTAAASSPQWTWNAADGDAAGVQAFWA